MIDSKNNNVCEECVLEEINLYDLLRYYAKNWLNLVIAVMVGATIGLAYTYFVQTPMYQSSATLLTVGAQRSGGSDSVVLNNYVELFTSQRVLGPVIHDQGYDGTYQQLASNAQASNQRNTDIINVSIATREPAQSKAMLESAIESFRDQARELYGNSVIDIKVVDAASLPAQPHNVQPAMQVGLAVAATVAMTIIGMFFAYDYRMSRPQAAQASAAGTSKGKKRKAKQPQPIEPYVEPSAPQQQPAPRQPNLLMRLLVGDSTPSSQPAQPADTQGSKTKDSK